MRQLLIVDDEKNIRCGLRAMIEREAAGRYDIHLACDAFEALDMIASMKIEILITDIRMPELDGIGLIKKLQEFRPRPAIVIVSGYDDFSYARAAIRYEVNEYLLKPVIREEVAEVLERIEEELNVSASNLHLGMEQLHTACEQAEITVEDSFLQPTSDIIPIQKENEGIERALQYIHDNYSHNINMMMVSSKVSFNYSYFSQAFRNYTGENFVSYLKRLRINKAKELLRETEDRIYEIAGRSGFGNTKNFNRVFRESEGVSPLEYRNQQKLLTTLIEQ